MKPDVWGPHAWIFLHSITLDYPNNPTPQNKENMINFINALGYVLPCEKCRNNFKEHLLKYPLNEKALSSKENLVSWMIDIHNCVNDTKKCKKLSHDAALTGILEHYQNNTYICPYIILFLIIFFLIILYVFSIIKSVP